MQSSSRIYMVLSVPGLSALSPKFNVRHCAADFASRDVSSCIIRILSENFVLFEHFVIQDEMSVNTSNSFYITCRAIGSD
jgi:hypothetical protein